MKTTASLLVVTCVLWAVACTKDSNVPSASAQTSYSSQAAQHFIGERFGGGIIFYLDNTGKHGLIAGTIDFEEAAAWSYNFVNTGARGTRLGKGFSNSNRIVRVIGSPADTTEGYAAFETANFAANGYYDWYLPSKDELNKMYNQKDVIGGDFKPAAYWSSTEADASTAWFQNFGDGSQHKGTKNSGYSVRPIRYF
jgi:hypothetical protein